MYKKIILLATILFVAFSCSKDQDINLPLQEGTVSFSFSNPVLANKQAEKLVDVNPVAIFISIINSENETVINNQKFDLLTFGASYITDEIKLPEGDYEITTFNIVDEDNIVVYASPLTGSENAEFVNNPLPIAFSVIGSESNTVSPEVIFVGPTATPEQFGYTSFSFTIVEIPTELETQDLYLTITDIDNPDADGNVLIEIPTQNFSLEGIIFIDNIPITIPLTEANENVIITVMYEGHNDQTFTLNTDQIAGYNEQSPFEVVYETTPQTIFLHLDVFSEDTVDVANRFQITYSNAYTYTTDISGISGKSAVLSDINSFIELPIEIPYIENETYNFKIYNGDYNGYKEVILTTEQIIATNENNTVTVGFTNLENRFHIYNEAPNNSLWFMAFDDDQGGNLTSFFYTLVIDGNQYDFGYSEANDNFYIVNLPTAYTNLELTIETSSGKTGTIILTYDEAQNYIVNPLQFEF